MNNLSKLSDHKWFWICFSLFLGILISYPMIGPYFTSPNKHMFAFGGDAWMMYYNVSYHIKYGMGDHLSSMNYPDGELIFFTAAQGSFAMLFNFINKYLFDISDYTVGIINSSMMIYFLIAIWLFYEIFIASGIANWRAACYAPLSAIMSPQFERVIGHHCFANQTVILLSILWLMRKLKFKQIEYRDGFFLFFLIFFTFNDPYTGFGSCLLILLSAVVFFFFNRQHNKFAIYTAGFGLLTMAILFLYFKINDPFRDRVIQQFGYFTYKATIEGFLASPGSLMDHILKLNFGKGFQMEFESMLNLGFPISSTLLVFLVLKIFKPSSLKFVTMNENVKYIFYGSILIMLYASGIIFLPFSKNFVESNLGSLLMFKAVARLSWPFWYACVLMALILIESYLKISSRSGYIYTMILLLSLWYFDIQLIQKPKFNNTAHTNFFSDANRKETQKILSDHKINKEDYQAILMIPKVVAWSDLFAADLSNFFNQFVGMKIAMETGLPLVHPILSRLSTKKAAEVIEFTSKPLIEKSLQKSFPNTKNLLVVYGKGQDLDEGERYILTLSDTLYDNPEYMLLSLPINKINSYPLLKTLKKEGLKSDTIIANAFFYKDFEDMPSKQTYSGKGAMETEMGIIKICEFDLIPERDSMFLFSGWTQINNKKYGMGKWILEVLDKNNGLIQMLEFQNGHSNEVHNDWLRADLEFKLLTAARIKISFDGNRKFLIDDVLVKPKNKNYYLPATKMYNNYRID